MNVLFLSYDGMTDPLGPSQVLPYLVGLARQGHSVHLASLEKPAASAQAIDEVRQLCAAAGIDWHPLRFRSDLPFVGVFLNYRQLRDCAADLNARQPLELIHARSYIPAMAARWMKRRFGIPYLFDMRGFWADERVEGGLWPQRNPVYRLVYHYFKRREAELLRDADAIVSLTEAGKRILLDRADRAASGSPITIIPCCADLDAFPPPSSEDRRSARQALDIPPESNVVAYLGSTGTWYLLGEMLDFFAVQRRLDPMSIFLVVTRDDPAPILAAAQARGLPPDALLVRSASRQQVAEFLAAADYGLFFIKPCFSKKASSPTKLGEFLALGLPVVTNSGVGDVDAVIEQSGAGVLVDRFDVRHYEAAIAAIGRLPRDTSRWRDKAKRWFDLNIGVERYAQIYSTLAGRRSPVPETVAGVRD
jgi:glycosyltransferase involved in cell wall biosynthesis